MKKKQVELEDQYDESRLEQQRNNTPENQQNDFAIRPLTDFKVTKDMSLSEMLLVVRMRNQYLGLKEYLESEDKFKVSTCGVPPIPPSLPKGPCRPGCCPPARLCPKLPKPPPCPTKPCDPTTPLKKLCDPCPSKTCPKIRRSQRYPKCSNSQFSVKFPTQSGYHWKLRRLCTIS